MRVDAFDYELPDALIAQHPAARRDDARLMILEDDGAATHGTVRALPELLEPGDLLVVNDTRVIPARLAARKPTGGSVELLLLERIGGDLERPCWDCLLRASRKPANGSTLLLADGRHARVVGRADERFRVEFDGSEEELLALGRMPLPPYIQRDDVTSDEEDRERYQTIFASAPGAVAAPTAGLHFSEEVVTRLAARGIELATITLHVGVGTFQPVRVEQVERHRMHAEWCELSDATERAVRRTRERGGRVVAVGTTVVRTLEFFAEGRGAVRAGHGSNALFIYPGFRFRVVDRLLTNFHLPRSTLLMLVCAFAGTRPVLAGYREAVRRCYRFYSYGDAMLLTRRDGP